MPRSRSGLGFILGLSILTAAITFYPELFLFYKAVHLPTWTAHLPSPIDTGRYITFVALLPVVFANGVGFEKPYGKQLWQVVLISPAPAILHYIYGKLPDIDSAFANALFHYIWVIGFTMLPAILLLVLLRWGGDWLAAKVPAGQRNDAGDSMDHPDERLNK